MPPGNGNLTSVVIGAAPDLRSIKPALGLSLNLSKTDD